MKKCVLHPGPIETSLAWSSLFPYLPLNSLGLGRGRASRKEMGYLMTAWREPTPTPHWTVWQARNKPDVEPPEAWDGLFWYLTYSNYYHVV